jgi:hypothetical protein
MKSLKLFLLSILIYSSSQAQDLQGAWVRDLDTAIQYMTIVDNYFVVSTFHVDNKKFIRTRGGSIKIDSENTFSSSPEISTISFSSDLKLLCAGTTQANCKLVIWDIYSKSSLK